MSQGFLHSTVENIQIYKFTAVLAQKSLLNKVLNTNPLKKSSVGTAESNDI